MGVLVANQRVVHWKQGACISVHRIVLGLSWDHITHLSTRRQWSKPYLPVQTISVPPSQTRMQKGSMSPERSGATATQRQLWTGTAPLHPSRPSHSHEEEIPKAVVTLPYVHTCRNQYVDTHPLGHPYLHTFTHRVALFSLTHCRLPSSVLCCQA